MAMSATEKDEPPSKAEKQNQTKTNPWVPTTELWSLAGEGREGTSGQ